MRSASLASAAPRPTRPCRTAAAVLLMRSRAELDRLARLEDTGQRLEGEVERPQELADGLALHQLRGWHGEAVHLARPLRQRANRDLAEVAPEVAHVVIQVRWVEDDPDRLPGGRSRPAQVDRIDVAA